MLDSQPPAHMQPTMTTVVDVVSHWMFDDDLAIGCECANPALQIERWGLEAATQPLQEFS